MRGIRILAIGLLLAIAASCAQRSIETTRTHSLDATANEWLSSKRDAPSINVTGVWDAGPAMGGGWGEARFIQSHSDITGSMGLYNIKGAVSGDNVYLVLSSNGRVYYTAHLRAEADGRLMGKAAEGAIVDVSSAPGVVEYPMILRKMSN